MLQKSCPLATVNAQEPEARPETSLFRTTGVQSCQKRTLAIKVCKADLLIGTAFGGGLHYEGLSVAGNPQADRAKLFAHILRGPIGKRMARDYRTEPVWAVGLKLDRGLDPAFGSEPNHQTRLVILVNALKFDISLHHEITLNRAMQEVAIIGLKPKVCPLPEIAFRLGMQLQARRLVDHSPC